MVSEARPKLKCQPSEASERQMAYLLSYWRHWGPSMLIEKVFHQPRRSFEDNQSSVVRTVVLQVDDSLSRKEADARWRAVDVSPVGVELGGRRLAWEHDGASIHA